MTPPTPSLECLTTPSQIASSLLAYVAHWEGDSGDERSAVVFAADDLGARQIGARRLDACPEELCSCRRAPEFDSFASTGKVPPLVLLQHDWWFECPYCGVTVTISDEDLEPCSHGDRVFCCPQDRALFWAEEAQREISAAIEAALIAFHGVPITDVRAFRYGGNDRHAAEFGFPGMQGVPARWEPGSSTVLLSHVDEETWRLLTCKVGAQGKADECRQ